MELRDLGGALWRHKPVVVLILVITAVAGVVGLRLAPKTYTATADVAAMVEGPAGAGVDSPSSVRATLAELVSSRSVVSEVQDGLDVTRDADDLRRDIRGEQVPGTVLIRITVEDRDPVVAADIANTVARVLPRLDPSGAFVFSTSDRAEPPRTASSPDRRLALGVGGVLALVLASLGALARDRRRQTVDDGAAVEESTSAPLLAYVAPPRDVTVLPALDPGTGGADAFRNLRVVLEAEASASPLTKVVVAGVSDSDVNVWLGANIAISLAGAGGRRVLLVDGRMGERFGRPGPQEPDTPGLYDVLTGTPLDQALSPGPVEGLTVLPSGAWGVQPPASLVESRFGVGLGAVADSFDVVVVLAPALDVSDDARAMAAGGSLLLVVQEGAVSAEALRAHADRVRAVGARILGAVLVGRRPERTST